MLVGIGNRRGKGLIFGPLLLLGSIENNVRAGTWGRRKRGEMARSFQFSERTRGAEGIWTPPFHEVKHRASLLDQP